MLPPTLVNRTTTVSAATVSAPSAAFGCDHELVGTGAYASLRGAGSLTGTGECTDSLLDVYTGSMHIDR